MRKWIPFLIVAASVLASAIVYPKLPTTIPTHWDMLGRPNGWSSRVWGAWVMPIFLLATWVLFLVLPRIDPRGSNYAKFGDAFEAIIDSIMLFILGLHLLILRAALGYPVAIERVVPFGIGVLLVVIGNLLPRARPNWFVGIRTPWTLSSDRVWEKTHRIGGRLFVVGGLLIIIAAFVVPRFAQFVLIAVVTLSTGFVLIYSYLAWKEEQTSTTRPAH
jgi:uncharacterized membrane protein